MKVQEITTAKGKRWLLLDDNYHVVQEVRRYLLFLDHCGKSPNTLKSYATDLLLYYQYASIIGMDVKDLCKDPGHKPVDILSAFEFWLQYPKSERMEFHIDREKPVRSDRTVNHVMNTVLKFYAYLASNHELEELDVYRKQRSSGKFKSFLSELTLNRKQMMTTIFYKKEQSKRVRAITRAQYNELFNACLCRRDKLLLAVLFEGGLRLGEALGVHLSDIQNMESGELKIVARENNENGARVKNYAEGNIYLPSYVVDLLVDYLTEDIAEYESDFLFLTLSGKTAGMPMTVSNAERLFTRLSKKTGIDVHPHMLRHGFAQEKLDSGWKLENVQSYLRHKNITSTEIYAQYTDEKKKEEMKEFIEKRGDSLDPTAAALITEKEG